MRLFTILVLMMLMTSVVWAGKIYRWVDENGVVQFSTIPPEKDPTKAEEQSVRVSKPATPTDTQNQNQTTTTDSPFLTPEEQETIAKGREITCQKARQNLTTLEANARVSVKDGTGNTVQLDDEQRLKRIEEEKKIIGEFCN